MGHGPVTLVKVAKKVSEDMRIQTSRFGELDIAENEIIVFPRGILGFEGIQRYVLLGDLNPFGYLQALDEPDLTFVVIDPNTLIQDYRVEVPVSEAGGIGLDGEGQTALLGIVTIPRDPHEMTANLQAPLVINCANRRAVQLILGDGAHSIRHPILASAVKSA